MEAILLAPVVGVWWALSQKVLDQHQIIQNQEQTILTQQEILEHIHQQRVSRQLVRAGAVVGAAGLCWQLFRLRRHIASGSTPSSTRHAVRPATAAPPQNYAPSVAGEGQDSCVLCLHYQRDSVLQPCRHMATCWECTQTMLHRSGLCPMCRTPVSSAEFVYVP